MSRHVVAGLILVSSMASPVSAQMSPLERQRLVAHLETTASQVISEVTGLSQAQLEFRPAPGKWSILEVLEHLVVVGPIYWDDLQRALKTPASRIDLGSQDAEILWYGIDRANRETAIAPERPPGKLHDAAAGLAEYRKQHARLVEYAKTTKDDLRSHVVERQRSDAYQWALLISTHELRHVLQIREIKTDQKFPR